MKLPEYANATVDERKITAYLLSLTHPVGRSKARYFISYGFSADAWQLLADALKRHAAENDVAETLRTPRGVSYTVEGGIDNSFRSQTQGARGMVSGNWRASAASGNSLSIKRNKQMIEELSQVVLLVDIPEHQLRVGDVGVVVDVHPGTSATGNVAGYSVEFVTMSGDTMAVLELDETQIRPVRSTDIAHVRELASAS